MQEEIPVIDLFSIPVPWYVIGPLMGLTVAGMYAVANLHLGVSTGYADVLRLAGRRSRIHWRLWFLGGTFGGAALVALLAGSEQTGLEYGALGDYVSLPTLVAILFGGGVLMGYGARMAGGCSSGHGITGCAIRSRASFVAAAVFMATAVGLTLLIHLLTDGAL
jgi:hypothetical protein